MREEREELPKRIMETKVCGPRYVYARVDGRVAYYCECDKPFTTAYLEGKVMRCILTMTKGITRPHRQATTYRMEVCTLVIPTGINH